MFCAFSENFLHEIFIGTTKIEKIPKLGSITIFRANSFFLVLEKYWAVRKEVSLPSKKHYEYY
jgi:hypothetical protein